MVAAGLVPPMVHPMVEANALHRARAQVQNLQNAMASEVAGATQGAPQVDPLDAAFEAQYKATQGEAPAADAAVPAN